MMTTAEKAGTGKVGREPISGRSRGARILVVEDDASIQLGLRMSLQREGYSVDVAGDGVQGLDALREGQWDLLILDVMLPRMNGYEVLRTMNAEGIETPVVVLSAKTDESDKVMGLDLGAQDYVTKPFGVPELLARVRAALRRARPTRPEILRFGDVTMNPTTREVMRGDEPIELTATEFDVLKVLADARGGILSRRAIFEAVWGPKHHGTVRTIDNFIGQLRQKLEENPSAPSHLVTVRGVGYRLVE